MMEDVQSTIKALELFVTGIKRAKESGYKVAAAAIPAQETAIWALKKQVPEKPVRYSTKMSALKGYSCPACGAYVGYAADDGAKKQYKYCPECGQKINWEVRYDG